MGVNLAAILTGAAGVIAAVTALVRLFQHKNGPAHKPPAPRPPLPPAPRP